ncbi:MAG: RNA methyltransferase [Acidimicrobiia bacterium]|nr:RNA methyltransferase [Acidimicrobiia bacterium]
MTPDLIDSPSNPKLKAWRSLRSRRERDRTGTVLIEGRRETLRAAEHLDIVATIVRDDVDVPGLEATVTLSGRAFAALSARQNPDGVAGVFVIPRHGLDTLPAAADLFLIGDGIEKPGNIGAMIRTADAFGATFVGSELGTDLFNPNVVRAAQGSLFAGTTATGTRAEVMAWITPRAEVVVAAPGGGSSLWAMDLTAPTAIVVGSEHAGVSGAWLAAGTVAVIPTVGRADSLNASVAAAVFLAEAARQRSN